MSKFRLFSTFAAVYGLLAVALGAFGAHALKAKLSAAGTLEVWKTAVDYQMWHSLAILAVCALKIENNCTRITLSCFSAGVFVFSGSLYALALGGPRWLGPITPIGGTLLIIGWALLIVSLLKEKKL